MLFAQDKSDVMGTRVALVPPRNTQSLSVFSASGRLERSVFNCDGACCAEASVPLSASSSQFASFSVTARIRQVLSIQSV